MINQPSSTLYGSIPAKSSLYGSIPAPAKEKGMLKSNRKRMNIVAICLNVFLPWLLFCVVFAVMSFSLHYQHPSLAYFVLLVGAVVVLIAVGLAYRAWQKKKKGFTEHEPTWFMFAAAAMLLALLLALVFGDMNFWYNMQPFYDIENLNTYPSVDPSKDKGQQLMDAGRAYFVDGSKLDLSKSMGFKNLQLYCVAPVVVGEKQLTSYDFWAVGIGCCSGESADFRCEGFNNVHARSGLRLMQDEERPFYRLAVQQAEAAYHIKAEHPLFFHWMQDPVAYVNAYRDDGFKYYLLGIFTHLAFSLFCVVCAVIGFAKLGR